MTTIVLADDHGVVRDGLRLLLETYPRFKVVGEADNGREAVRIIADVKPDIAILDISMPGLNGIEAMNQIRVMNLSTRVLILSMYSSRRYIAQALRAGARGYLLKDSVGRELIDAVDSVQSGHLYLGQQIADVLVEDYLDYLRDSADDQPLSALSPREREVVQLVVEGHSSAQIADILNLAPSTVDTYRSRIMQKLGIDSLPELVKFAIQHGLIPLS